MAGKHNKQNNNNGNGNHGNHGNNDGKTKFSNQFVPFSNETSIDIIINNLKFLNLEPTVSDQIIIKDKNGVPVKNKRGENLYFYIISYQIMCNDNALFYKIKFSQRSNAMLPTSKNAYVYDVQLYINNANKDNKDDIKKKLFSNKPEITINDLVLTYSDFTIYDSDDTYGIISFNIKNENGKKAYDEVGKLISKIMSLMVNEKSDTYCDKSALISIDESKAIPTSIEKKEAFPVLSKNGKSCINIKSSSAKLASEIVKSAEEVKAVEVKVAEVKAAEVKVAEVAVLADVDEVTKHSPESIDLVVQFETLQNIKKKYSNETEELKKAEDILLNISYKRNQFEIEMKKKLEEGLKELENTELNAKNTIKTVKLDQEKYKLEIKNLTEKLTIALNSTSWITKSSNWCDDN